MKFTAEVEINRAKKVIVYPGKFVRNRGLTTVYWNTIISLIDRDVLQ